MLRAGKWFFLVAAVALLCGAQVSAGTQGDRMIGMVVGRTGSVLHIGIPQPVKEGTIFQVKPFDGEPPIAEAKVISCTQERPFMALAKVIRGDTIMSVPTGVHAYADVGSVSGPDAPQPMVKQSDEADTERFSLEAGAFYPSESSVRQATTNYWPSYRVTYSLLKNNRFETLLTGEYSKADGDAVVDSVMVDRTTEIIPVTVMGRLKPMHWGDAHLFFGGGVGIYSIRTSDNNGTGTIKSSRQEVGQELSVGVQSSHGWLVELRYRNIENTDLKGYLMTIGSRF